MYVIFIRCDKRTSNNKHKKQSQNDHMIMYEGCSISSRTVLLTKHQANTKYLKYFEVVPPLMYTTYRGKAIKYSALVLCHTTILPILTVDTDVTIRYQYRQGRDIQRYIVEQNYRETTQLHASIVSIADAVQLFPL